jgi:hypothetical protein
MFCAFMTLLTLVAAAGMLVWLGWRRVAAHLNSNEAAKHCFLEHIVTPLLLGRREPKPENKPVEKKIKGRLV